MVTSPQQKIMFALNRHGYLTVEQTTRLLYAPTSRTFVREQLLALWNEGDDGYVGRFAKPKTTTRGQAPYIYHLRDKGIAYLRALGRDTRPRSRQDLRGLATVEHML